MFFPLREYYNSDMSDKTARKGSGRFQWNAGGWFGSQVGSTFWLLLLAIVLVPGFPGVAVIVFVCFVVPNIIGLVLWSRRNRIEPYAAIQYFIAAAGVSSLVAFICWDRSGYFVEANRQIQGGVSYWILLIFPVVMLMFHFLNKGSTPNDQTSK